MDRHPELPELRTYRVCLGHTRVSVQGTDIADAIRVARKRLSHDMPRLWDKIHQMADQQFRVERVQE